MFCKSCGSQIQGVKFCTKCGKSVDSAALNKSINKQFKFFTRKRLLLVMSVVAVLVTVIAILLSNEGDSESTTDKKNQDIASSVVNIYCTGITEEDSSGGSGTILTDEGLILTNAHIIPDGGGESIRCLVTLPDPVSGSPNEIYTAYPLVIPEISEKYDLAFVKVDDVYFDHEEGIAYGEYPKKFPAYDPNKYCKEENVKLGESIRIYGYPSISGGYALTITEGVVSSLMPNEGFIFTSAKISHGNSGGLAVDKYGCRIGVPAMVTGDDYESLGIIISNDLIYEFISEFGELIN